jgi:thioredoxin reductase (NADPH)
MADEDDSFDPTDPYNRETQTFPKLSGEQVDRIAAFGSVESVPKGTALFTRGDRSVDFYVVLDGTIEITDGGTEGREESIHFHRERQFTGELDLFNNREILVSGHTGTGQPGHSRSPRGFPTHD